MTNKKMAYLYLIITFCAWGSLYVVGKFALGKVPVVTVLFLRYLIAGVALFLVNGKSKIKKIERQDFKYIFLVGFVGYFLSVGAQLIGIKLSNASIASLVNAMNPVTIMFFAAIILKEKLTITIFGMFIAAACTFPVSICELIVTPNVQFNGSVIISLLYMGIVCTALAYVFWNKSLSMIEAGTCSLFYPVQPMVSAMLGMLFLGEKINANFIFGAILIIGGVLFSIIGKKESV